MKEQKGKECARHQTYPVVKACCHENLANKKYRKKFLDLEDGEGWGRGKASALD